MRAESTVQNLVSFWKEFGVPDYAQFDNSTVFQGSRKPDSLGKVIRFYLSLDVIPVFAPPHKTGYCSIRNLTIASLITRWAETYPQTFKHPSD